jgi:SM-20-related protein
MAHTAPILQILDDFAPDQIRARAWDAVCENRWYFGHQSTPEGQFGFWKMDLESNHATDRLWKLARPRCEAIASGSLIVLRKYANGHTYGLGGDVHVDDARPGTFTLLYYPMPTWKPEWGGETVFHDRNGEIAVSVLPKPGRAVFFDSRIPHAGRAPNRSYGGVRVTIAWKLHLDTKSASTDL